MGKLLPHHKIVLAELDDKTHPNGEYCVGFAPLVRDLAMSRSEVRRIVRHMARRGYAEYHRALFTEEGDLAGAGYCITEAGRRALQQAEGGAQ